MVFAQDQYNALIFEGNRSFDSKNYEKAATKYMEAAKLKANDFGSHYNMGNALYKQKKYDEAKAEYQKALSYAKNPDDINAANYNLGNAYMQSNDASKAAEFYKKALKKDPYNEKVRKNYEIAMLKNKDQNKDKKDQGKGGGQGGNGDGKDPKEEQDPNGKNQQGGGNGNENQNGQGEGKDASDQKKNEGGKMPKDLEDAILNNIKGREQETARKILNKNTYSVPQSNEKDW